MKLKLTMLLGLLMIASLVLTACGGGAPTEAPATQAATEVATEAPTEVATEAPTEAAAAEPAGTLTIWADDTRAPILQDLADEVLAAYNVELVVELKSAIRDDFQVAAPLGEGPDIIVKTRGKDVQFWQEMGGLAGRARSASRSQAAPGRSTRTARSRRCRPCLAGLHGRSR